MLRFCFEMNLYALCSSFFLMVSCLGNNKIQSDSILYCCLDEKMMLKVKSNKLAEKWLPFILLYIAKMSHNIRLTRFMTIFCG